MAPAEAGNGRLALPKDDFQSEKRLARRFGVSTSDAALSHDESGWRERLAGVAASESSVRVRLYDPYRLLAGQTRGWVEREVRLAFRRSGVTVRFTGSGGAPAVPATLYPEIPERWGVPPRAIGVAIGAPGERRSVFLSLGAAKRAIGLAGLAANGGDDDAKRRLGVALGRVLAHEITHTIAPDCPHTETGLMAERLNRRMLTAPGVGFDETATRHLQRGAEAFGTPENG